MSDDQEREDLVTAEEVVDNLEQEDEITALNEQEDELEQEEQPEQNEVVERAKKYGHLSKEEWVAQGRDPDQWKSPEEFDKTGKILEQLYAMRKKVDQRDREIQALVDYQQRTSQREYERAKQDLEQRLAAAKDDMDVEGVEHYKEELIKLNHMEQREHQAQSQQQQQVALQNFKERNQHWFNDRNPDLMNRAIEIDEQIKKDINDGVVRVSSYDDISRMIEKRMQYEYPDRVLGQKERNMPPMVSPSRSSVNKTSANKTSSKRVFQNLSQEHRDTFNVYKRINPSITEAEFINRLKQDGEL